MALGYHTFYANVEACRGQGSSDCTDYFLGSFKGVTLQIEASNKSWIEYSGRLPDATGSPATPIIGLPYMLGPISPGQNSSDTTPQ